MGGRSGRRGYLGGGGSWREGVRVRGVADVRDGIEGSVVVIVTVVGEVVLVFVGFEVVVVR